MRAPLAYFLTWTCHGAWLHGDERGSVDRWHNVPGTNLLPPDPERAYTEQRSLVTPAMMLDAAQREVVRQTIVDHCGLRTWELLAYNVRSNHVHVVLSCPQEVRPEQAMSQLKSWCTRRLREAGLVDERAVVWTRHGSTRWINDAKSLSAAAAYVLEGQSSERYR